jgi:hypothetical protein
MMVILVQFIKITGYKMKKIILISLVSLFSLSFVYSNDVENQMQPTKDQLRKICLIKGQPPLEDRYTAVKQLKLGKHGYGGVAGIQPKFIELVRKFDGDAVINYRSGQRFGFWPWQIVRPVITGTVIKWEAPEQIDCIGMGGTFAEG